MHPPVFVTPLLLPHSAEPCATTQTILAQPPGGQPGGTAQTTPKSSGVDPLPSVAVLPPPRPVAQPASVHAPLTRRRWRVVILATRSRPLIQARTEAMRWKP